MYVKDTNEIDNTLSNHIQNNPTLWQNVSETKIHIFHFLKQMRLNHRKENTHEPWHSFTTSNLTHINSERKYPKIISHCQGCWMQTQS